MRPEIRYCTFPCKKRGSVYFRQGIHRRENHFGRLPLFEDWGRDTMIALPGICISQGNMKPPGRFCVPLPSMNVTA